MSVTGSEYCGAQSQISLAMTYAIEIPWFQVTSIPLSFHFRCHPSNAMPNLLIDLNTPDSCRFNPPSDSCPCPLSTLSCLSTCPLYRVSPVGAVPRSWYVPSPFGTPVSRSSHPTRPNMVTMTLHLMRLLSMLRPWTLILVVFGVDSLCHNRCTVLDIVGYANTLIRWGSQFLR
jgi:hypothetical protein